MMLSLLISASALWGEWLPMTSGTTRDLQDIQVVSPDTAYACGRGGVLLKTVDRGQTWTVLMIGGESKGSEQNFSRIYFRNSSQGLVLGDSSGLLRTEDGGKSWEKVVSENATTYQALFGSRFGKIFATADGKDLRMSSDMGKTWMQVGISDGESGLYLRAMHFPNSDTGFALAGEGIWRTLDGGSHWSLWLSANSSKHPRGVSLTSAFFQSGTEGVVAGPYYPCMAKTVDGAATFFKVDSVIGFNDLDFPSPETGFAVGLHGTIKRSLDRGATWQVDAQLESKMELTAVHFFSPEVGMAVGRGGTLVQYVPKATPVMRGQRPTGRRGWDRHPGLLSRSETDLLGKKR